MEAKEISKAVIKRLPRYYRYLGEWMEENVERISSNDLSKKMHVTASQIRQDLNNFGGFGQQGYGYNVRYLYTEIGKILGLDTVHPMIILGAGNLGQALANYVDFEKRGFKLVGIFDVNPVLEGIAVRGIEIQMLSDLPLLQWVIYRLLLLLLLDILLNIFHNYLILLLLFYILLYLLDY